LFFFLWRCSRYSDWVRARRPRGHTSSPSRVVQTDSGDHTTSYPMGTGSPFPESKMATVCCWPVTSNYSLVQERVSLYIHSPMLLLGVVLS
jgi:hypothetical protein